MKKEKLEDKKLDLGLENKSKNQYKVIESFCGIKKGHIMTINDKESVLISKKLVKKC